MKTMTRRQLLLAMLSAASVSGCARVGLPAVPRGHCKPFFADGMSFLPREPEQVQQSGLDLFVCDVSYGEMDTNADGQSFYHRTFELCDWYIGDVAARIKADFPTLHVAGTAADIGIPGRQAAIFQFQSCEPLGTDLSRIAYFRDKSLRILQLTHNESNAYATSYFDEAKGTGLTALGLEAVREMNRLRIIPDVSHGSEATTFDVVNASSAPVLLSHGSCRALLPHPRAATNRMIRAIAESGGVFGVFMMSFWLTDADRPNVEHLIRHLRHAVKIAGIEAVGIANDYPMAGQVGPDGVPFDNVLHLEGYRTWWDEHVSRGVPGFGRLPPHAVIPELNHIRRMETIHDALKKSGFSDDHADKIIGGNWLRFFKQNLQ